MQIVERLFVLVFFIHILQHSKECPANYTEEYIVCFNVSKPNFNIIGQTVFGYLCRNCPLPLNIIKHLIEFWLDQIQRLGVITFAGSSLMQ